MADRASMQSVRISVVIPSFDQRAFLEAAIASVLEQDHGDKEVLVMDGGSRDGSAELIERHAARLTHWQSGPDGGQANAISQGIARSSGRIVGWLNSDDVLAPGALRRVAEAAARAGSADRVFFGGHRVIDAGGVAQELHPCMPLIPWVARKLGPIVTQPGTFFGRQAYDAVGGLDCSLGYGMDLDLWFRFLTAGVPFAYIPAVQADFRRHPEQKGHSVKWLEVCARERELVYRKYGAAPDGTPLRGVARAAHLAHGLLSGSVLRTLAFRITRHRRLRAFQTSYT